MAGAARILGELAEDDIDWLLLAGDARAMPAGAVLIEEGAPVGALFIVLDGLLSVAGAAANGRRAEQRGSGDILGEMSFVDGRPPSATVTALEDSTVFAVPAHSLRTKLQLDAGFSARFHRAVAVFLADRLRGTSGAPGAPARLAAASALGGNVHLAQGRFDRLVSRLSGDRPIVLTGNDLTIETVIRVAEQRDTVDVSPTARDRVARSRAIIERLAAGDDPVYGLNTGLGALKHLRVDADENGRFQRNVLMSHAVGVPPDFDVDVVRAVMLVRLNGMARGGSGIQPAAFELLLAMLNAGIHPVVPSRGSVGMSDLAPLAHLALPLIGMGEADVDGRRLPGGEALSRAGLSPVELSGKDALALCSANSASVGHAALVLGRALAVVGCADIAAGLSLEGYAAPLESLAAQVHEARPYSGQLVVAERLRALLDGSGLWGAPADRRFFEPLSMRCVAQVHGACQDALAFVRKTVETELNSTGDNPVVLLEQETVLPTGNFHPAALAMAFDMLGVAVAQVVSMATNRVIKLMWPQLSRLPSQLSPDPGVNVGLGVLQKTITALSAETSFLAAPASLNFTPIADGVEDHATMVSLSVAKAARIVDNATHSLGVELLCAAQAIDIRGDAALGHGSRAAYDAIRARIAFLSEDRPLAEDLRRAHTLVASGELLAAVQAALPHRFGMEAGAP